MELPYPGGAAMDKLASQGDKGAIAFPSPAISKDTLDFSLSGLKTAVVNYIHNARQRGEEIVIEDVCASLTHTAVDILVDTTLKVAKDAGRDKIVLAGGVASNSYLRESLLARGKAEGYEVLFPPPVLCTDNAVMIASRAYFSIKEGKDLADLTLNAQPSLRVGVKK
jgi:N6-L-threonylcarbamoyladenine synthase